MKNTRIINALSRAMTLMELLIVVAILAITSGLITYSLNPNTLTFAGSGANRTAPAIATVSAMKALKEAIVGTTEQPGLWHDLDGASLTFPYSTAALFLPPDTVASAMPLSPSAGLIGKAWFTSLAAFNPKTCKGWRGPYVSLSGGTFPYTSDATNRYFTGDLHPAALGSIQVPFDAWGNPIIIQWGLPTNAASATRVNQARMISAGPNGILDSLSPTSKTYLLQYSDFVADRQPAGAHRSGDDVIMFFFWPDLP